mmetsp:Transcript_14592/g.31624  ORF Transcript_14592/g.31624 Transcript_14592/m.31624 type:complete len:320 (+) Transcript_14592:15-974(+)
MAGDARQRVRLVDLPDELFERVAAVLSEECVLRLACTCKRSQALCSSQHVWKVLSHRRWPHLPGCAAVHGEVVGKHAGQLSPDSDWRTFHRTRTAMPRWRELCARYDESLHIVRASDPTSLSGCTWVSDLAAILTNISTVHSEVAVCEFGFAETIAFSRKLMIELAVGMRMGALHAWCANLDNELCEWYDGGLNVNTVFGTRELLLRRVFIGRSALELLRGQVTVIANSVSMDDAQATGCAGAVELWREFDMTDSLRRIDSSLDSFYLEGGDMSLPAALRPPCGVPVDHFWWWYMPPTYISGGCPHVPGPRLGQLPPRP